MLSFICFIGIFSDRETLELLAASISFEDLLPRLSFIWFCCLCGTIPLVFIFDFRKCRRLSETQSFSSRWMAHSFFHLWSATHILQFSSGNCPLNFVWLSHSALSLLFSLLKLSTSLFPFISFITLMLCGLPHLLLLFRSVAVPLFFVWMSHKYPVCLHFLCLNVTQISLCLHYF